MADGRRRVFMAGAGGLIGVGLIPLPPTPASVERLRFVTELLDSEAA